MFSGAAAFEGRGLPNWDVASPADMRSAFNGAEKFNADISGWQVDSLRSMSNAFTDASDFSQNLCEWGPKIAGTNSDIAVGISNMFTGANCRDPTDPNLFTNPPSPFCHVC